MALAPDVRTDLIELAFARTGSCLFEGLDHIDPELDEWLRVERERWAKEPSRRKTPVAASAASRRGLPLWAMVAAIVITLAAAAVLFLTR